MRWEQDGKFTKSMIELNFQGVNSLKEKEDEIINLKEEISILKEEVSMQKLNARNSQSLKDSRKLVSGFKIKHNKAKGKNEVMWS